MTEFQYEKNKVSILIPVYNRELLLEECIESALNQTYDNFEVVIVDNASTDKTWETCQAWAKRDERIKIYRNDENIGPVRNWQRCLDEATGEFCKFLFSDDKLLPDCIQTMHNAMTKKNIAFVYSSVLIGESYGKAIINYARYKESRLVKSNDYLYMIIKGLAPVSPGSIMIRTHDLKNNLFLTFPTHIDHSFEDHGAGPDVMIMLKTAEQYQYVAYIPKPLVFFRRHENSFSVSNKNNRISNAYVAINFYHLKASSRVFLWANYAAKMWMKAVISQRKIVNMKKFLIEAEGNGSLTECFCVVIFVPLVLVDYILRK